MNKSITKEEYHRYLNLLECGKSPIEAVRIVLKGNELTVKDRLKLIKKEK